MKIIIGDRNSRKTTKAIELANQTGAYLVVATRSDAYRCEEMGALRSPLTMAEYLAGHMKGPFTRKVVFDDVERCLSMINPNIQIEGLSITKEFPA